MHLHQRLLRLGFIQCLRAISELLLPGCPEDQSAWSSYTISTCAHFWCTDQCRCGIHRSSRAGGLDREFDVDSYCRGICPYGNCQPEMVILGLRVYRQFLQSDRSRRDLYGVQPAHHIHVSSKNTRRRRRRLQYHIPDREERGPGAHSFDRERGHGTFSIYGQAEPGRFADGLSGGFLVLCGIDQCQSVYKYLGAEEDWEGGPEEGLEAYAVYHIAYR